MNSVCATTGFFGSAGVSEPNCTFAATGGGVCFDGAPANIEVAPESGFFSRMSSRKLGVADWTGLNSDSACMMNGAGEPGGGVDWPGGADERTAGFAAGMLAGTCVPAEVPPREV